MFNLLYAKNDSSNSKNSFLTTSELIITPSQNEEVSPYSEIKVFIPIEIDNSSIDKLSLRLKLQKALEKNIPNKWIDGEISYKDGVLSFKPNEPLVYGRYKAVLAKQLKTGANFILQEPYEWEFSVTATAKMPIKFITLNIEKSSLNIGETTNILVTATYVDNSTNLLKNGVTFNSSNEAIATIDNGGVINAKSEGVVTLSATAENFNESITIEVLKISVEENSTITTQSGSFAKSYSDLIASNATIDNFDEKRFCVLRGKVKTIDDRPLSNVTVSIKGHSEYGSVQTDSNGEFAIAIEGGGVVTIRYQKDSFATSDRKVDAPWKDIVIVEDIAMVKRDSEVTKVALDGSKQTHISRLYSDDRGERATTLVFNGITKATITHEDGTTEELSELNVRATK